MAASPLPSGWPKRGRKCYVTLAFSGTPNKGEQNQKWLPHSCLAEDPKQVGNATSPLHSQESGIAMSTMHSRGSTTKGNKIRSGCVNLAFSWAQKRAEMLCHTRILGDPQQRGTKSEVADSPLPSRGPKIGRRCYITPAFSEIHNKVNKIRSGPQQMESKSEVATSPLPSRGPKRGRKCYVTPAFSGILNKGERPPYRGVRCEGSRPQLLSYQGFAFLGPYPPCPPYPPCRAWAVVT